MCFAPDERRWCPPVQHGTETSRDRQIKQSSIAGPSACPPRGVLFCIFLFSPHSSNPTSNRLVRTGAIGNVVDGGIVNHIALLSQFYAGCVLVAF